MLGDYRAFAFQIQHYNHLHRLHHFQTNLESLLLLVHHVHPKKGTRIKDISVFWFCTNLNCFYILSKKRLHTVTKEQNLYYSKSSSKHIATANDNYDFANRNVVDTDLFEKSLIAAIKVGNMQTIASVSASETKHFITFVTLNRTACLLVLTHYHGGKEYRVPSKD